MCDNILGFSEYSYTISSTIELSPIPSNSEPSAFEKAIINALKCWNGLHWGWKLGIGIAAFAIAIVLTVLSQGSLAPLMIDLMLTVEFGIVNGIMIGAQTGDIVEGLLYGLSEGMFWCGIFSLASAITDSIFYFASSRVVKITPEDIAKAQVFGKEFKKAFGRAGDNISVVSGAKSSATGKTYYGVNQGLFLSKQKLSPKVKKLLPLSSIGPYPLGNCAEVQAINNAILAGERLRNLTVFTVKINTGLPMKACANCTFAFNGVVAQILTGINI